MNLVAGLNLFSGQQIARGDIKFLTNANGIEGASIIAGGEIDGTSSSNMGLCGTGMEGNFETDFFRLAI